MPVLDLLSAFRKDFLLVHRPCVLNNAGKSTIECGVVRRDEVQEFASEENALGSGCLRNDLRCNAEGKGNNPLLFLLDEVLENLRIHCLFPLAHDCGHRH